IVSLWNDPASGTLSSVRFYRAFELKLASDSPPPIDGKGNTPEGGSIGARQNMPVSSPSKADPGKRSKERMPQEAGEPRIIVKFADGQPAAMERTWGLGRVILFSSTANNAWNDWPVRLSFVPLVHRALGSIVQRQDEGLNI